MAINTKRVARRGVPPTAAQLRGEMPSGRTPTKTSAADPAAAPFDTDDEAAGRPPPSAAVERALAEENLRRAQLIKHHATRTPVGPAGRVALLIGLLALAGIAAAWLVLAF